VGLGESSGCVEGEKKSCKGELLGKTVYFKLVLFLKEGFRMGTVRHSSKEIEEYSAQKLQALKKLIV
jgi:hypothetical protein